MLYYLIKTKEDLNSITLKAIIAAVTENLSQKQDCVPIVKNAEDDNCIISALLNLLKSINLFIKNYTPIPAIQKVIKANDVCLAASIILNKDKIVKTQKTKDKEKLEKKFKPPKPINPVYLEMLENQKLEDEMKGVQPSSKLKLPTKRKPKQVIELPSPKPVPKDDLDSESEEEVDEHSQLSSDDEDMDAFAQDLEDGMNVAEVHDDEMSEGEQSYGDDVDVSSKEDGFAPNYKNFIKVSLSASFNDIEDIDDVTSRIIEMLNVIKLDDMPKIVKNNRINFFATH